MFYMLLFNLYVSLAHEFSNILFLLYCIYLKYYPRLGEEKASLGPPSWRPPLAARRPGGAAFFFFFSH